MKKHLIAIAFLISAFLMIAHDVIPHHHSAMDETELNVDHIYRDAAEDHGKHETGHNLPNSRHQHVFAQDDYFGRRNNYSIQKVIKISITSSICLTSYSGKLKNDFPHNVVFISKIELPDPFPFIISPNAMRGSPSNI